MIYFTADWHLDHENIIEYCGRPFNKLHVMNHVIVKNFNTLVGQDDLTYHLGDFSLRGSENWQMISRWVKQLNGKHILVLGNHDKLDPFLYVECGFQSVHTYLKVEGFHCIHDPAVACSVSVLKAGEWWLCGHVHNLFSNKQNVINVGVDVWNFKPVSIEEIRQLSTKCPECNGWGVLFVEAGIPNIIKPCPRCKGEMAGEESLSRNIK